MRFWFVWGVRNLFRKLNRSIGISVGIGMAVLAVLVMAGFADFSYRGLKNRFANSGVGYLQIAREKFFSNPDENKNRLNPEDQNIILSVLKDLGITSKVRRFNGLVGSGSKTQIFRGEAVEFDAFMHMASGLSFDPKNEGISSDSVILGRSLASKLQVGMGQYVSLVVTMESGRTNASDFQVAGLVSTGSDELDSVLLYAPLYSILDLLDSRQVDQILLKTPDLDLVGSAQAKIKSKVPDGFAVNTWEDRASYYQSVRGLYGRVLYAIQLVLVCMAFLVITISFILTIHERRGELGMLRAIGFSRGQICYLSVVEGAVLGAFGGILGGLGAFMVSHAITFLGGLEMPPPPGSTEGYKLFLDLNFEVWIQSVVAATLCGGFAAFFSTISELRIDITRALGAMSVIVLFSLSALAAIGSETGPEILGRWDRIRKPIWDSYKVKTQFEDLDELGKVISTVTYQVLVGKNGAVAVSVSDRPGNRMAVLTNHDFEKSAEGMWIQSEKMRQPMRVSASQRLIGQASYGDVVGIRWALDYQFDSKNEQNITLKSKQDSAHSPYPKIILRWNQKMNRADFAEYYGASGKMLKKSTFFYDPSEPLKLIEMLIENGLSFAEKTRVRFGNQEQIDFPANIFNPEMLQRTLRRVVTDSR